MNPEFLFDNDTVEDDDTTEKKEPRIIKDSMVPWEMIRELLDGIQTELATGDVDYSSSAMPMGWYDVLDEDGNDSKVLVFQSQLVGYRDLLENKQKFLGDVAYTGAEAQIEFFNGFGLMPSARELQLVMDTYLPRTAPQR